MMKTLKFHQINSNISNPKRVVSGSSYRYRLIIVIAQTTRNVSRGQTSCDLNAINNMRIIAEPRPAQTHRDRQLEPIQKRKRDHNLITRAATPPPHLHRGRWVLQ